MSRELRDGYDRLVLLAPFGVLFRDHLGGRVIADGLRVELRRAGSGEWQRLAANPSGVFAAHALPGLRLPIEGSPPTRRYEMRMRDERDRFLPLRMDVDLPAGLYDPGLSTSSPPEREPAVPLYSAPTRAVGGSGGVVRASLRSAADPGRPAAWARVELWLGSVRLAEGVADAQGGLLLACGLPPPREPPLHGSPPTPVAGFERLRWDVTLRAHWEPALAEQAIPDLHRVHRQPEVPLLRAAGSPEQPLGPQVLRPGGPLVVRSDGSSYLFVGA
jgi:hypothetical protein